MRAIKSIEDAQIVVREILEKIKVVSSSRDWDFRRLRIKNASDAVDLQDYVTLSQIQNLKGTAGATTNITNINSSTGGISSHILNMALVHGVVNTITSPSVVTNDLLFVSLNQPVNGQAQISWDAGFEGVGNNNIDIRNSKINTYTFVGWGASGKWRLFAMQLGL